MRIEIDLPDSVIRKIKALNLLVGRSASDIEDLISTLVDRSVSSEIITLLGLEDEVDRSIQLTPLVAKMPPLPPEELRGDDVSGISSGLGDDAPPDEDDSFLGTPREESHAKVHSLTENEIYADQVVRDPEHQAVVDAPRIIPGVKPEAAFAKLAGIPAAQEGPPPKQASAPARARARKKQRPLPPKAKVSVFDSEANSF